MWDFRSSEIDFDAIQEVKLCLELYGLQIFQVVFKINGGEAGVFGGGGAILNPDSICGIDRKPHR